MPLVKYTPQFIERQYVPTDVNLLANVMGTKQKQFDAANDMSQAEVEKLYDLDTTQGFVEGRNQVVTGLQDKFNQAISNRGGDAGAALKDIQGIIASAKKDPFFQLNKTALDRSKELQQQLARNPNLHVLKDTRNVKYKSGLTQEDLDYSVFDPEELDKAFEENYGKLRSQQGSLSLREQDGYKVASQQIGMSKGQIEKMRNNDTYSNLLSRFPQLAGQLESNPALKEQLVGRINNKLNTLFGGFDEKVVENMNKATGTKVKGTATGGSSYWGKTGYDVAPSDLQTAKLMNETRLNNDAVELAKSKGLNVNSLSELEKMASASSFGGGRYGTEQSSGTQMPGSSATQQYLLKRQKELGENSGKVNLAKEILKELEVSTSNNPSYAKPTFNFNRIASANPTEIEGIKKVADNFKNYITSVEMQQYFKPHTSKDANELSKVKPEDLEVVDIIPNFERGASTSIVVKLAGRDKDGKTHFITETYNKDPRNVNTDPNQPNRYDPIEQNVFNFISQADNTGGFSNYKDFMDNTEEYLNSVKTYWSPKEFATFVKEKSGSIIDQLGRDKYEEIKRQNNIN